MTDVSKSPFAKRGSQFDQSQDGKSFWTLDSRVLDILPAAVYFCDAEGLLIRWNRVAVELWGREPCPEEQEERFCGSFRIFRENGEFIPHADCPMADTLRTGEPQRIPEVILERPDGTRRIVMVSIDPIFDENGELIGAVNVFQDITERKQSEEALAYVEKRFRRLLEKLPAAAYVCDSSGLITDFNHRAAELWGRLPKLNDPLDRFCGSFKLFSPAGERIHHERCWMALSLEQECDFEGKEIIIERPDGTRRNVLAYVTPFDEAGQLAGAINILVDITERIQSQELINQLLQKEKRQTAQLQEADRRKDEFLAMLAHELRNPLAPIVSGLELLKRRGIQDEARNNEMIELMTTQVNHLVRLVDDLLDVSRIVHGRVELLLEPVELAPLVRQSIDVMSSVIEARGHELKVTLPQEPLWLKADSVRLVQILENLLNNACKYTDPGGVIELVVSSQGDQVQILVQDNGIGIDEDLLPRIFDLFTQANRSLDRSQGGLGIGLTLVNNLVERHGGSISACSDGPGKGSRFLVQFPLVEACGSARPAPLETDSCAPRRVLIVDDSMGSAQILALLIGHLGPHEIEMAHDGLAALETAERFQPDLILLDIGLPKLDGLGVARKLRQQENFKQTCLVALTGYGQEEDRRKSLEAGFNQHLVKPVGIESIKQLLATPPASM